MHTSTLISMCFIKYTWKTKEVQVEVLHSKFYLSRSKVLPAKCSILIMQQNVTHELFYDICHSILHFQYFAILLLQLVKMELLHSKRLFSPVVIGKSLFGGTANTS